MSMERTKQRQRWAKARREFLAEVEFFSSNEVGSLAESTARNPSAVAYRLVRERKVFAVGHGGADYFPAFQFIAGQPRPAIAAILKAFEAESSWTVAIWFLAPSGWLGGERPLDRLQHEPDAVVEGARRTAAALVV